MARGPRIREGLDEPLLTDLSELDSCDLDEQRALRARHATLGRFLVASLLACGLLASQISLAQRTAALELEQARSEHLAASLEEVRSQLVDERAGHEQALGNGREGAARLAELQEELAREGRRRWTTQNQLTEARAEATQVDGLFAAARTDLERAHADLGALERRAAAAERAMAASQAERVRLRDGLNDALADVARLERTIEASMRESSALRVANAALEQRLVEERAVASMVAGVTP